MLPDVNDDDVDRSTQKKGSVVGFPRVCPPNPSSDGHTNAFVIPWHCSSGVSKEAVEMADCCTIIPMDGFVESFNISVAAALAMYEARTSRERLLGSNADLTEEEQRVLRAVMSLKHQVGSIRQPSCVSRDVQRGYPPRSDFIIAFARC